MKLTKRQQRTANKLAFPVIAMLMLITMMALSSAQRVHSTHAPAPTATR